MLICIIFVCYAHLNIFTWNLRDINVYYYYYYYYYSLNGGFYFAAEPRHGGKSPFSRKRIRYTNIFFYCFELSNKFLYVNKYGPILSVELETIVGNVNIASNRDYNYDTIIRIYME